MTTNLANEVTRATNKENELAKAIETESKRADIAEKANATAIDAEKSRAEAAELDLSGRLDIIEGEDEGSIKSAVNAEKARAIGVEDEIKTSIGTTNSNLDKAKENLNKLITDETTRATKKEDELSTSISNEKTNRENAITKEANDRSAAISSSISQEVIDRNAAIAKERDRAAKAEEQLQKGIEAETTRATGVEEAIKADLATYAKSLELVGGKDTKYIYTFTLKDSSGKKLSEKSIDLPIESVVVSGRYDASNKNVILTLDSGKEISFSVADLIEGLVSDATFNNHVNNTNNPHGVTAKQVGLGNVANVGTESVITEDSENNITSGAVYSHTSNKNNPHSVTKAQVGLGNVDNTSDADKPVSTATQAALNSKVDKVSGKSLILDTEITRLAGMSDGANKVEASTNGKIKIDGSEVSVYDDTALSERISEIEPKAHSHANKGILDGISQADINS